MMMSSQSSYKTFTSKDKIDFHNLAMQCMHSIVFSTFSTLIMFRNIPILIRLTSCSIFFKEEYVKSELLLIQILTRSRPFQVLGYIPTYYTPSPSHQVLSSIYSDTFKLHIQIFYMYNTTYQYRLSTASCGPFFVWESVNLRYAFMFVCCELKAVPLLQVSLLISVCSFYCS